MPLTVTDNQNVSNTYTDVVSTYTQPIRPNHAFVNLYTAPQVVSSQSGPFTVACSKSNYSDEINLFALEFSDLAGAQTDIVDASASYQETIGDSLFACGTLSATAIDDLIVSLYANITNVNPANIAPMLGTIPACTNGQNGQCVAQDGSTYVVGGMSTYTANGTGNYTPQWTGPAGWPTACVSMALKVIGP